MRWPKRRRRKGARPEAWTSSGGERRERTGWSERIEVTAAFLGIVLAGFFLWPKIENVISGDDDVRLEIAEPIVNNPPAQFSTLSGEIQQRPETEPTVAATVRNRGEDTAWIEEARIRLVAGARLNVCYTQGGSGDVPTSKRYQVMLPQYPAAEPRVYRRDLHVEVQPGHGVRPVLSFSKDSFDAPNLYALEVEFIADPGDRVLKAGRFVIGVPEPPSRSGYTLPESDSALGVARGQLPRPNLIVAACFRHNLEQMQRLTAEPGKRSAEVAALTHLRPAATWDEFADDRPARQVVAELLEQGDRDGALYAVEIAELEGGAEFAAAVRNRAVAQLLRLGREEMDSYARAAIWDAEGALSIGPSAEASNLLWKAKAARRAEEEHAEQELAALEAE
jgi:hypothetical protein